MDSDKNVVEKTETAPSRVHDKMSRSFECQERILRRSVERLYSRPSIMETSMKTILLALGAIGLVAIPAFAAYCIFC